MAESGSDGEDLGRSFATEDDFGLDLSQDSTSLSTTTFDLSNGNPGFNWITDTPSFAQVAKIGLGDVEISDDEEGPY